MTLIYSKPHRGIWKVTKTERRDQMLTFAALTLFNLQANTAKATQTSQMLQVLSR